MPNPSNIEARTSKFPFSNFDPPLPALSYEFSPRVHAAWKPTMQDIHPYLSAARIQERIEELAVRITTDYRDKDLCLVAVLNGALMFTADLVRLLPLRMQMDFIKISSYQGTSSNGAPKCLHGPALNLTGKDVLVVDDILDTGLTLTKILDMLGRQNPSSLRTCVLLDKPERRRVELRADYAGFGIEDQFVVGYGLDYNEQYRNLPYIGILKP